MQLVSLRASASDTMLQTSCFPIKFLAKELKNFVKMH